VTELDYGIAEMDLSFVEESEALKERLTQQAEAATDAEEGEESVQKQPHGRILRITPECPLAAS
jgi:hypothetical protein